MDVYLTEDIFSRLLKSLAFELRQYYGKNLPVLIGVGISGVEIIGRLPEILEDEAIETYTCDVVRKGDALEVTNFPGDKIKDKKVLITYVRVDTGKTLRIVANAALAAGATDVKTMSIAARNTAICFPHFFSTIIHEEDNYFLLLEGYPPDIEWAYPPVLMPPGDFLRELNYNDCKKRWPKCGDPRIDKSEIGEYLYFLKISKKGKVFVVEDGDKLLAVLHFIHLNPKTVKVETLAVDKEVQGKGIGKQLLLFFIDYCKFNGVSSICLDAFKEREAFYANVGFRKIKEFKIPTYGEFSVMQRRVN
ncbi:MAG: GNAT family N-acetyltransferase [Candidatus Bathyarchaeota archaeon]|nr:GNAT family N-acetyltransferase [Candidatus Bathyarchaeota archaeon]